MLGRRYQTRIRYYAILERSDACAAASEPGLTYRICERLVRCAHDGGAPAYSNHALAADR